MLTRVNSRRMQLLTAAHGRRALIETNALLSTSLIWVGHDVAKL